VEKCKLKARPADMALGMHYKRRVMSEMNEHGQTEGRVNLWLIAAGAVAGALAGYVLRTPRGRRVLDDVIVMLDDFSTSCTRFSEACTRAQLSATESWNAVTRGITSKSIRTR
jgi:hypothetical protein